MCSMMSGRKIELELQQAPPPHLNFDHESNTSYCLMLTSVPCVDLVFWCKWDNKSFSADRYRTDSTTTALYISLQIPS